MIYEIREIQEKLKSALDEPRFEHTMGVMYTAGSLAKEFEYPVEKAMLAGLLHDCAKCITDEEKIRLCKEHDIPLIVDASQSAGVIDLDFEKLGADFIAMPGHKALFGPQGTGILLCKDKGTPLLSGGSGSDSMSRFMPDYLPDRHEAGTHNVPGIAGLMAGMAYVLEKGVDNIYSHEQKLLGACVKELSKLSGLEMYYGPVGTQSGVISFMSRDFGCEELAAKLGTEGVCVRAGLHCAPLAHSSAGTIAEGTVRISFSPFVSLDDVQEFGVILQNLLCTKS